MNRFHTAAGKAAPTVIALSAILALVAGVFIARHIPWVPASLAELPREIFIVALPTLGLALGAAVFFSVSARKFIPVFKALLLAILPTILTFVLAWNLYADIPASAKVAVTFYAFSVAVFLVRKFILREWTVIHDASVPEPTLRAWFSRQGAPAILFVIAVTLAFLFFATKDLGKFSGVDEALWIHDRIPKYWESLGNLEFRKTSVSDKPGLTIAFASGTGLLHESDPVAWKRTNGSDVGLEQLFFSFRIGIVIAAAIFLPLFYFLLDRLLGRTIALVTYPLIILSPITLGMTKIVNPDSLLWVFAPLSFLAYLTYLKRGHIAFLFLSAVILGLVLLTKYVGNILFVLMFGVVFLEYVLMKRDRPFLPYLKRSLLAYALWTFGAISTFFVLFPATWVRPEKLLNATILSQAFVSTAPIFLSIIAAIVIDRFLNRSRFSETIMRFFRNRSRWVSAAIAAFWVGMLSFVSWNVWAGMARYDFQSLLSAPKTIYLDAGLFGVFATNFYPLLFGVVPIVFAGLFLGGGLLLVRPAFSRTTAGKTLLYGIVFIALYHLGSSVNGVGAITRYQIMLYPVAGIIAGIAIGTLVSKIRFASALPVVLTGIAIASLVSLSNTPFPMSYASTLLPQDRYVNVKDMGDGSYEAAMYLNSLPNAKDLTIWTDKNGVCRFFDGICRSNFDWKLYQNDRFDYVVVSSGRESRTTGRVKIAVDDLRKDVIRFDKYYEKTDGAEWELLINGRPGQYVKIYPFMP
jgi:hypothetical protein